ncbi:hypothetical protein [Roseivirga pacifica]|uniref:hypothetical protein n=1 Tax=Roseivirga pacifica TaxID=1267423 RepID=UPI002094B76D|nr:hypothetical protein [Roseivirga pacifica]MCO6359886.1 hypothetical protein [Roseivirga pacifica]MCO6367256.1 hypothetical protein [Roseivirga pacifica]MCO6370212.1 hypothetical protein [Roseivirga pacifica]MCO6374913.1 hypothetical protein [Roseivirga pacifica]MCO6380171.1 hypothetical protein [Roseivirga pacifica]
MPQLKSKLINAIQSKDIRQLYELLDDLEKNLYFCAYINKVFESNIPDPELDKAIAQIGSINRVNGLVYKLNHPQTLCLTKVICENLGASGNRRTLEQREALLSIYQESHLASHLLSILFHKHELFSYHVLQICWGVENLLIHTRVLLDNFSSIRKPLDSINQIRYYLKCIISIKTTAEAFYLEAELYELINDQSSELKSLQKAILIDSRSKVYNKTRYILSLAKLASSHMWLVYSEDPTNLEKLKLEESIIKSCFNYLKNNPSNHKVNLSLGRALYFNHSFKLSLHHLSIFFQHFCDELKSSLKLFTSKNDIEGWDEWMESYSYDYYQHPLDIYLFLSLFYDPLSPNELLRQSKMIRLKAQGSVKPIKRHSYNSILRNGKYAGMNLDQLLYHNPSYLLWSILNVDNFFLTPMILVDHRLMTIGNEYKAILPSILAKEATISKNAQAFLNGDFNDTSWYKNHDEFYT